MGVSGEAPFMGCEPLALLVPVKFTPGCPGLPSALPTLKLWLPSQTKLLGSPAVLGEAVAGAVETIATSFVGSSWPEPVSLPSALKFGKLSKQTFLSQLSTLGDQGCSGQTQPPQAPGQIHSTRASSAYFCGCTCEVRGLGVPVPGTLQSTCRPFQLADQPMDLHSSNCDEINSSCFISRVSCSVDRGVKAQKFADAMWSRTCTPCPCV
eukprot:1156546-Pelagomonas_calceolata.AAC.6